MIYGMVSREAVLKICAERVWNGADDYYPITANAIAEKVKMLPSAQTVDAFVITRCKDCKHWARNDGMFKDFDEREWHHCPHLGIDTDGYFSCIEGKRKEE